MKVSIVPYHSDWPQEFKREASKLRSSIADKNICIEHVGSTAIEGLDAKPIIDIMIGLDHFNGVEQHISAMVQLGYNYLPRHENEIPERRFFIKALNGVRTHHVHMVQVDTEFWKRHLLFRDHLRSNADDRNRYLNLKLHLSKQEWQNGNEYAAAKSKFIGEIEKKVLAGG